ncbi:hypothetical protein XA68_16768 [Ophiocordyceps unilateralis]|uniref:Initiator tRNA phosphoribosyl transferase n=1 Tax=Ophiocordyceps unilateralis TaxID=268505 RepID=A0A2A9P5S4_OPHUN|nr:hypothetical protein XA68_16768 [Ophiocordyceps unilateralis]
MYNDEAGMPDALSTTIPVWCTVLNQMLLPHDPLSAELFLPPHLPPSTQAQIRALIPGFVADLAALGLDWDAVAAGGGGGGGSGRRRLSKPLRPIWIGPHSVLPEAGPIFAQYRPVVCCTASRYRAEDHTAGYVQGAADDCENWSHGLTPSVFWRHVDDLLAADDAQLVSLIARLVSHHQQPPSDFPRSERQLTPHLSVCALPLPLPLASSSDCCHVVLAPNLTRSETWVQSPARIDVGLGRHKTASRNLRLALPDVCAFVSAFLGTTGRGRIVVACESGTDLCVGTALALSCRVLDDDGSLRVPDEARPLTKPLVKARLAAIMAAFPEANPSRQTLQSVNSFLLDWRT